MGQRGAVATSQPLATLAGMQMFWAGGNAVDAAIATAIALTVVEPTSNGIGADAFALVWHDGQLHGLNASGRSPKAMTPDQFAGMNQVPKLGWLSVTVPGAISAWKSLWERWGKLPFEQLFEPAIHYAEQGFPVSPETARAWKRAASRYLPLTQPEFQPFKSVFFPGDRPPSPGEIWASPVHAATLRDIAQTTGESFYRGKLAEQIVNFSSVTGGLLTPADLTNHQADWVAPICTSYRGFTVWEMPPNTQGMATLVALNILEGYDLNRFSRESVESYHVQIEAMKLAFADTYAYVADSQYLQFPIEKLLDKLYAAQRKQSIHQIAIPLAEPGFSQGGTVYLATADQNFMVSLIQSNYYGFGSGVLIPNTGIALQNRASGFTLDPGHPNQVGAEKRSFHTIIPGFLTQENEPLAAFGVMGGSMQPQGHVQVVTNLVDYHLNPQAALDAPRWRFVQGNQVMLEQAVGRSILSGLSDRGHDIQLGAEGQHFGKGQIILKQANTLIAASEPRADGLAIVF